MSSSLSFGIGIDFWLVPTLFLPQVRESRTALDSGFHVRDSGFQVLDSNLCQWNLNSGFRSLVDSGFLELYSEF